MLLKQLLVGLGLWPGLACAIDFFQTPLTVNNAHYDVSDLLLKDDQMRDFTIDDPSQSFWINWRDLGVASDF
ncbi:uncharacterized protein PAN0_001d0632 [Moesziomyces antarcticus]|uniref:Uncharacterized protein n=1 Tax=Pseudozyma antarctica TaxID=84753 RepID=A0A5C3FHH2_PSEA2|nr:uncharacterized protein PAN0_001d0632 [Moesziomyces antarcticus]GAK62432.1 hypothetical protein PAN0_001d0632 [Moesziomyces antarcticus]SPO42981.1 uncharacterized protein PSANT_00665 [Moesziomyces antarcticus]